MKKFWSPSGDCRNVAAFSETLSEIETGGYFEMITRLFSVGPTGQATEGTYLFDGNLAGSPTPGGPSSQADVEPLGSNTKGGTPYKRPPAVEAELRTVMLLSQPEWKRQAHTYLPETLVHMISKARLGHPDLWGDLLAELSRRIARMARKMVRGLDRLAREEIVLLVEAKVLKQVLTEAASRKAEFLEISVAETVRRLTKDEVHAYKRSPMARRGDIFPDAVDDDGKKIQRPMELVHDKAASPEAVVLALRDLEKASAAVKNPRQLEAINLYFREELPIISNDPARDSVAKRMGATEGEVKRLLASGLKCMREALGEEK